ncbi:4'-phosphopantetheinyl transferase family protein [Phycicoccus flavus]|nr:4'-phosphopantetheinyl transferase superfamily protein [Phycicoccus flavus]
MRLGPGCDLWVLAEADVDRVAHRLGGLQALSPDERARLDRLVRPGSRRRHLGARVLARWAMSRYLGVPPAVVEFAQGRFGRPVLADPARGPDFNLTHTDGMIACAVTPRGRVGVDAETYPARPDSVRLVGKVLTERERALLLQAPPGARPGMLAEHWVLKEAYTKALGLGLHRPFDSFDIRDGGLGPALHDPHTDALPHRDWTLQLLRCGAGHVMALASAAGVPPGSMRVLDAALVLADVDGATAAALPRLQARMTAPAA